MNKYANIECKLKPEDCPHIIKDGFPKCISDLQAGIKPSCGNLKSVTWLDVGKGDT